MKVEKYDKLYKIASMLSPSIYETVFHYQYQGRLDKDTFILPQKVFEKYYISEHGYKMFLDSNKEKLKNTRNYVGLGQLYKSVISSVTFNNDECKLLLEYTAINNLVKNLKEVSSLEIDTKSKYTLGIVFNKVSHFSINKSNKNELLIKTDRKLEGLFYLKDQIVYIDDDCIEIVISLKNKDNEITYLLISTESIEVRDYAKELWKKTFKSEFSMLYDYFININNSYPMETEDYFYKNTIESYKKFVKDFLDI